MSPIYLYQCEECQAGVETILPIGADAPICHGEAMSKRVASPVMIKMKGEGGYPSRRKQWKGTAPFTTGYNSTKDKNSEFYGGMHTRFYGQASQA